MADQNLQHLLHLLERNKVFASFHYLNSLPQTTPVPNRPKLLQDLQRKISKAKGLTADINTILDDGDYPEALSRLKRAQALVHDFPNIQTDIDFITASISTMEKNLCEAKILARKGKKQQVNAIIKTAQEIDRNNNAISEVTRQLSRSRRKKGVTGIFLASLAVIIPTAYLSFEQITLQQANELWSKAHSLIESKQYARAEAVITQMDNRLQFVRLSGQTDKMHLLNQSTRFNKEGSEKTKDATDSGNKRYVKSLLASAQEKIEADDYVDAIGLYDDALAFSAANIHIDDQLVAKIHVQRDQAINAYEEYTLKNKIATFHALADTANTLFRNDSWLQAAEAYQQSLASADGLTGITANEILLLKQGYSTSMINNHIENGEMAFNQKQYKNAITSFEQCLTFMENNHQQGNHLYSNLIAKLQKVKEQQFRVKFVKFIDYGDELYAEKEYDLSIGNYEKGLALLASSEGEVLGDRGEVFQKKIARKIAKAKERSLVQTQSQFLVATYKKILRVNFNLSRNIHFKKPEIVFIGNQDNHLIYTVSAFGSKSLSASPIKYEIDYKFNMQTGQWQVNDIRLEV